MRKQWNSCMWPIARQHSSGTLLKNPFKYPEDISREYLGILEDRYGLSHIQLIKILTVSNVRLMREIVTTAKQRKVKVFSYFSRMFPVGLGDPVLWQPTSILVLCSGKRSQECFRAQLAISTLLKASNVMVGHADTVELNESSLPLLLILECVRR